MRSQRKRILFILGTTGVGKNTVIDKLQEKEPRLAVMTQCTTRVQRDGESGKLFIDNNEMDTLSISSDYCVISTQYNDGVIRYALSYVEIRRILDSGRVPVIDWAVSRMQFIDPEISREVYSVYLLPPSLQELERRLKTSQRDNMEERIEKARREICRFRNGEFVGMYNESVINENVCRTVEEILLILYSKVCL